MNRATIPAEIDTYDELPADGMIVVKRWDGARRVGFHVESATYVGMDRDFAQVWATPVSISTGVPSGPSRIVALRFGLDSITALGETR